MADSCGMEKQSTRYRLGPSTLGLALVFCLLVATACATKDAVWVHENLDPTENFHAGTSVLETPPFPNTGAHRATARSGGARIGADIELSVRAQFADFSFLDRVSFSSSSDRAFSLTVESRTAEIGGR